MRIWAVIPIKTLEKAKNRLASVLSKEDRKKLVLQLFEHTLQELTDWQILEGILVVSSDPYINQFVAPYGFEFLLEKQPNGLNGSTQLAAEFLDRKGVEAMLVVHGDLPLVSQKELNRLVEAAPSHGILIAPDRHQSGTNVLWVAPPLIIPFAYGCDSFQKHQELANNVNCPLVIFQSETLGLDIDFPDDFSFYSQTMSDHSKLF
ncbi:MAG: 2-phospho-L-lactate guanylyltransferase [Anaerolineaceae bacterium]|nr:2-phospho-L-lactate guanylyltransferase [Anaerolineaceae bacterium]